MVKIKTTVTWTKQVPFNAQLKKVSKQEKINYYGSFQH